jgi:hypothetical protein
MVPPPLKVANKRGGHHVLHVADERLVMQLSFEEAVK